MKTEKIKSLSYIKGTETFSFEADGFERNLKDFVIEFPYAYYKRGVWNSYEKIPTSVAVEKVNNSGYGADISIKYDERWENGYTDGVCELYLSCPCDSDMW